MSRFQSLPPARAVTLAIAAFLAVALSVGALFQLVQTVSYSLRSEHGSGVVRACRDLDTRGGGVCTVEVVEPARFRGPAQIDVDGLFTSHESGQRVELWVRGRGNAAWGGWHTWVDTAVLVLVALGVVTGTAIAARSMLRDQRPTGSAF